MRVPHLAIASADIEDPQTLEVTAGQWREGSQMTPLSQMSGRNVSRNAKAVREHLKDYYNSAAGAVHWQERMVD